MLLTLFCSVSYNDLSTSFAGLLDRQRCTETLLVLAQALPFFKAVLLHDLMGHCTPVRADRESIFCYFKAVCHHCNLLLIKGCMEIICCGFTHTMYS